MANETKPKREASSLAAILVVGLLFVAFLGGGLIITSTDSGQQSTSGLNTLSGYNVANEISSEWGLNYSSHTFYLATLVLNKATGQVTATFPAHKDIGAVFILTKNGSQTAYDLYQKNLLYTYQTVGLTTGVYNLSAAYLYFGYAVNATGTTSASDKGVQGFSRNITLYGSSVNDLGQNLLIPGNSFQMSPPTSMPEYAFYLQHNASANASTGLTLTFTQQWYYTVPHPVIGMDPLTFSALFALGTVAFAALIYWRWVVTEELGEEDSRVMKWQTAHEMHYALVALGILAVELGFIGWLGMFTPLFGWGALIAGLTFAATFTVVFTSRPTTQKWGSAIGVMELGIAFGIIVNVFFGNGTINFNYLISGNALAAVAGFAAIAVSLPVLYIGLLNTKRVHFRRRYSTAQEKPLRKR